MGKSRGEETSRKRWIVKPESRSHPALNSKYRVDSIGQKIIA
jgi:hypothetical protein